MAARAVKVKNKAAADMQITAEQLLREAFERQEVSTQAPNQQILDQEELDEYRLRKRKEFEDSLRKNRHSIGNWLRYTAWEETQGEWERVRSIFERAFEVEPTHATLWLKYAEFEMRNKNINHARNLWDRAITIMPRVNQFWYKYIHMEEMLGNYVGVRTLFERWMEWQPDKYAWTAYIKFEFQKGDISRIRDIYRRFVVSEQTTDSWIKWAKFEEKQGEIVKSRQVFESAIEYLGESANDESFFIAFAKFEERCKEFERARTIYKYALDHIPKHQAKELYKTFIQFEKQYGDREGIEDVILNKRRFQYEDEIKLNPVNYDIWFDYVRLEETHSEPDRVRDVYERAIANVPPTKEKRYWRRYIYLWINYAIYEEMEVKDVERARAVYKACLNLIPHKVFTFAKIWVLYANLEIRQKNLTAARQIYGNALGQAPNDRIFNAYIELEMQLGEMDRCRKIFQKWLETAPHNCKAWSKFADLERDLQEIERARAIYELATQQTVLDMPELLWKAYIDFEVSNNEYSHARTLYRRLLQRTKHVKVWISYAKFEVSIGAIKEAREVFKQAFVALKNVDNKEERVLIFDAWREFEEQAGDETTREEVNKNMPRRVKKQRKVTTEAGQDAGLEEYYDYIFPDEEEVKPKLKILEMAKRWKQDQKKQQEAASVPIKTEDQMQD
eukprot:TRINITY_DN4141_c0_g1_i1.p1 TRINITY_DN4141_c0_g1~~TRINITY_DN4141_c0_g1_i1.p1  ORF type:complete len:674 (+),score=177.55 TRINITY_DN4141_c0_g1_i1:181-2202(+)